MLEDLEKKRLACSILQQHESSAQEGYLWEVVILNQL
jgi:hypothetical protein